MKNSFIAFALCMVGGQVHGVSSNNDSTQILSNMMDKNVLVGDMVTLMKVRQSKESPSLRKVPKYLLLEINKYMTDLSCESTTMGNDNLSVACIRAGDKVVAARIDDNSNDDPTNGAGLRHIISDLQHQHGPQVPIQVHTPNRAADFSGVTGKLYSDAEKVTVCDSHDLDMYIKPGGTLETLGHSGQLGTNAGDIRLVPYNDVTMICDNENKQVTISTDAPNDKPVTVKLDNFQGELLADGPQTTVKVQNSRCERAAISRHATALFDHTTITGDGHSGVYLSDHASLVLCGSNVKGAIKGTSDCDVFKVDSTGTVRAWQAWKLLCDDGKPCGDYTVSSKDNGAHVPTLMAQEIDRKNHFNNSQKAVDTVRKFDATWAKCQMPNHNAPEESKEARCHWHPIHSACVMF